jgi:hypothetical protein
MEMLPIEEIAALLTRASHSPGTHCQAEQGCLRAWRWGSHTLGAPESCESSFGAPAFTHVSGIHFLEVEMPRKTRRETRIARHPSTQHWLVTWGKRKAPFEVVLQYLSRRAVVTA